MVKLEQVKEKKIQFQNDNTEVNKSMLLSMSSVAHHIWLNIKPAYKCVSIKNCIAMVICGPFSVFLMYKENICLLRVKV